MIHVEVVADSISPSGKRITTLKLRFPRYVLAEFLTHRAFSRSASSSRAIPVSKMAKLALDEMVFPIRWGKNQRGMQASNENLAGWRLHAAILTWKFMARVCAAGVRFLSWLGLHKQWANRPIEWFSNISVVVTSTEWDNFFALRIHEDAQGEIAELALAMTSAIHASEPQPLKYGEWHLPFISRKERIGLHLEFQLQISTARCARTSYLGHDGQATDWEDDLGLFFRLVGSEPIHASPTEHQATPTNDPNERSGNFVGWKQHRKLIEEERVAA